MAQYYSQNDQYVRERLTPEEAFHITEQVRFVKGIFKGAAQKRSLEIGADNGSFSAVLRKTVNVDIYYEEMNPLAKQLLDAQGMVDASQVSVDQGFYDLIVLRHVYEHIVDPKEYLRLLKERLVDGGSVFIEVPDYSAIDMKWSDPVQLEHVNYFSLASLQRIADRTGFTIEKCSLARTIGYSTTSARVLRVLLKSRAIRFESCLNPLNVWENICGFQEILFKELERRVEAVKGDRIALYGAGTITTQLLAYATRTLGFCRVYDKDPKKVGRTVLGVQVQSADDLASEDFDHVFVLVDGYENEVLMYLRIRGVDEDRIITLKQIREAISQ